jgi:Poly A polymerase regulatory subunit
MRKTSVCCSGDCNPGCFKKLLGYEPICVIAAREQKEREKASGRLPFAMKLVGFGEEKDEFEQKNVLPLADTSIRYRRQPFSKIIPLHMGQQKLFIGELYFLTKHGSQSTNIVYAGAAPGTHILALSEIFPNHIFHLIDPRGFDKCLDKNDRIHRKKLAGSMRLSRTTCSCRTFDRVRLNIRTFWMRTLIRSLRRRLR